MNHIRLILKKNPMLNHQRNMFVPTLTIADVTMKVDIC